MSEPSSWSIQAATLTDRGQVRTGNEDAVYLEPATSNEARARGVLCVVADGMGGYNAGEVASRMAVHGIRNRYYAGPSMYIVDALRSAIETTNLEVWQAAQRQAETSGMGCTLTAAVIINDDLVVGHVGDSRAYLVREGGIAQLTRDHSWVAEQVEAGTLTREQANRHPQRNVILRAVGARSTVEVDIIQEKVRDGDIVVMCSDGLSTIVSDEEIGRIVLDASPDQAVRQLVTIANKRGGPDNITAAVLRVQGPSQGWFSRLRRWMPLAIAGIVLIALAGTVTFATSSVVRNDNNPAQVAPAIKELPTPAATRGATPEVATPLRGDTPAATANPVVQGEAATILNRDGDSATLRSAPVINDSTRRVDLPNGTPVVILETRPDGENFRDNRTWYRVEVRFDAQQLVGWVWSGNVKRNAAGSTPSPSASP